MAIIKVHNKARNTTYVYESESYWDKELKQPRSNRKLIGKIDPTMGAIVPTGKRAKANSSANIHSDTDCRMLYEQALTTIEQKDIIIHELRSKLSAAKSENKSLRHSIKKACNALMDTASGKDWLHG